MSFQPGANLYTQGFGSRPENLEVPVIMTRAPTSSDVKYPVGKMWVDKTNNATYTLTSISTSSGSPVATWTANGGGSTAVATLTGDSGTATPSSGNIQIAGTSNQITTAASGAIVTLSLPAAMTVPGSLTTTTTLVGGTGITATTGNISATAGAVNAGTSITATAGDITATLGNVIINGAAKQLRVHGGAVTDFVGQATLTNGTVTVANTNIAATDRVIVTRSAKNASTAYGTFEITITPATNFVITSCKADTTTETNDVSTVDYFIFRQV